MQKLKERKIQIVGRNGQALAAQAVPKRTFSFFKLFSSSRYNSWGHSVLSRNPPSKNIHSTLPKADPQEVRSWVALEERIVHDYKAQKIVPARPVAAPDKNPVQEKAPIFETLSIQTVTSTPRSPEKVKKTSSEEKGSFFRLGTAVLALGWLLAGLLSFLYVDEMSLKQDIDLKLAQARGENKQLKMNTASLKLVAGEQRGEIQKLNTQIRTLAGELGAAQAKAAAFTAMEKSYREELLRVTSQYEEQIDGLRNLLQVRDEFVKTLQAHVQAIDKLVSEGGLATAFSAAAKAVEDQKNESAQKAQAVPPKPQGEVVMVNKQYQFIIVNLGAEQGATAGGLINIFQDGKPLAKGRLERVYPSMSAGTVLDEKALQVVKEGDGVTFS